MNTTAKLSTFVVFILVGARVFSLTFYGVNGHVWVEHLLTSLPGGQLGFLIVVNILIFVLAFFLDFFELSFIIVPLIGPVADKLGIDLIWFGVLLAVNMQTSFMHPPFGFALFYLRSVAPAKEYLDRLTGRQTAPVTTGQIYWGAVPFVLIQVLMVGLIIAFPNLVTGGLATKEKVDIRNIQIEMPVEESAPPGRRRAERPTSRRTRRRRWSARCRAAGRRQGAGRRRQGRRRSRPNRRNSAVPPRRPRGRAAVATDDRWRSNQANGAPAIARRARRRCRPGRRSGVLASRALFLLLRHPLGRDHEVVEPVLGDANHSTSSVRNFFHGS